MNAMDIERYVAAAAQAQGLTLEAEQLQRVVTVFTRNADLAKLVLEFELPETIEPAPIFTP
jgi:Protein of unknown function (DUF4089)